MRALAHAVSYAEWRSRPPGDLVVLADVDANRARRVVERALAGPPAEDDRHWLTGADAMEVLAAYGISVLETSVVADADGAAAAAAEFGVPVAIKASGPSIVHKSELGGVRLGVDGPDEARLAYEEMAASLGPGMTGAVVQPMAGEGVETIAGFVQNDSFGPLVLFGLGGTAVELLGDHQTRLAPLTDTDARDMVLGLRSSPLLTGYRGSAPVDVDALCELLLRLGRLAEDLPELVEADCNPVVALPSGAVVVDARIGVRPRPPESDERRRLD